jgi:hypothetical protein
MEKLPGTVARSMRPSDGDRDVHHAAALVGEGDLSFAKTSTAILPSPIATV